MQVRKWATHTLLNILGASGQATSCFESSLSGPLAASVASSSEISCKSLLRPSWSLSQWEEKKLYQSPWPAPLATAEDPQRLVFIENKDLADEFAFDKSQPAVLVG